MMPQLGCLPAPEASSVVASHCRCCSLLGCSVEPSRDGLRLPMEAGWTGFLPVHHKVGGIKSAGNPLREVSCSNSG